MTLPAVAVSQSPLDKFREYLASRPRPQRFTEQQRELLEHVFECHSHFDADKLIADLKHAKKRVSRATVYRTLSKLVDAGLLRRIELGDCTMYDHAYGYPAHDHLVCERCHTMTEFQSAELEALLERVASEHEFRPTGHTLVIRGTCAACSAARAARHRLVM